MERLAKDLLSQAAITQLFLDTEQPQVKAIIASKLTSTTRFKAILKVSFFIGLQEWSDNPPKGGIDQLFNQLTRPRLRTLIPDVYKDVSYVLDEDGYATAEYQDIVRKRFMKVWDGLTDGYKVSDTVFVRLTLTPKSRMLVLKTTIAFCLVSLLMPFSDHGKNIF